MEIGKGALAIMRNAIRNQVWTSLRCRRSSNTKSIPNSASIALRYLRQQFKSHLVALSKIVDAGSQKKKKTRHHNLNLIVTFRAPAHGGNCETPNRHWRQIPRAIRNRRSQARSVRCVRLREYIHRHMVNAYATETKVKCY